MVVSCSLKERQCQVDYEKKKKKEVQTQKLSKIKGEIPGTDKMFLLFEGCYLYKLWQGSLCFRK